MSIWERTWKVIGHISCNNNNNNNILLGMSCSNLLLDWTCKKVHRRSALMREWLTAYSLSLSPKIQKLVMMWVCTINTVICILILSTVACNSIFFVKLKFLNASWWEKLCCSVLCLVHHTGALKIHKHRHTDFKNGHSWLNYNMWFQKIIIHFL